MEQRVEDVVGLKGLQRQESMVSFVKGLGPEEKEAILRRAMDSKDIGALDIICSSPGIFEHVLPSISESIRKSFPPFILFLFQKNRFFDYEKEERRKRLLKARDEFCLLAESEKEEARVLMPEYVAEIVRQARKSEPRKPANAEPKASSFDEYRKFRCSLLQRLWDATLWDDPSCEDIVSSLLIETKTTDELEKAIEMWEKHSRHDPSGTLRALQFVARIAVESVVANKADGQELSRVLACCSRIDLKLDEATLFRVLIWEPGVFVKWQGVEATVDTIRYFLEMNVSRDDRDMTHRMLNSVKRLFIEEQSMRQPLLRLLSQHKSDPEIMWTALVDYMNSLCQCSSALDLEREERVRHDNRGLVEIAYALKDPFDALEKMARNCQRSSDLDGKQVANLLIAHIRDLRESLGKVGIGTVEDIHRWGRDITTEFDVEKHSCSPQENLQNGSDVRVITMGISVEENIINRAYVERE